MLEIIAIALHLLSLAMLIRFLEYSLGEPFQICHFSTNFFYWVHFWWKYIICNMRWDYWTIRDTKLRRANIQREI